MSNSDSDSALIELLAPDGYYTYLGVTKPLGSADGKEPSAIDEDVIKKNYRKLSLKHHPDKGGDADTFHVLNRAQRVLMNPKLRKQYDILGIDLDDDDVHNHENSTAAEDDDGKETSSSQGIVQEIAGTVLAGVIQLGVRTLMLGSVSVVIVRYRWTLYPALAFLAFIIFRIFQQQSRLSGGSLYDTLPPTLIATGLLLMHGALGDNETWNKQFWIGESVVIGMFLYNSLSFLPLHNALVLAALVVFSLLSALWFRGNWWNYAVVIGLIVFFAVIVALAFPIMELLFEAILNEKLKKVGDKVRHHHQILQNHYEKKARR